MKRPSSFDPAVFAPYPELAKPGPKWRVLDSGERPWLPSVGVTDMDNRVVYTPLAAHGSPVSTHEMGHVALSPPQLPRVRFDPLVLHAVEDARVNLALDAWGLGLRFDPAYQAEVRLRGVHDLRDGNPHLFLLRAVASLGTSALPVLLDELPAAPAHEEAWVRGCLRAVESRLETSRLRAGRAAPFPVGLAVARELARELRRRGFRDALKMPGLSCCVKVEEKKGRARARIPAFMRRREAEEDAVETDDAPGARPGELLLREPSLPLGRRLTTRSTGMRPRPATEGCHVTRPHRWALDGAIFRRPVPWRGGTVLIDVSGSMHLTPEMVSELVEASGGAALVAIYSGRGHRGELRVVARGGRRARPEDLVPFGSGNVVDLPCLEWLSKQTQPRLWVSDGGVTGVRDKSSPRIRRRCAAVVRRGRIERLGSAKEAVRRLAGTP